MEDTASAEVQTFREYAAPQELPPLHTYSPTNVTELREGDFSTLSAADVRSLLGTLIRDLQKAKVIG